MALNKKTIALAAIPVVAVGWFLFRPELLFINSTVNETLPVSNSNETKQTLKTGEFTSYGHETKGKAEVVRVGEKTYLRLSEFHTSNGPDVHVYLVKGNDGSQAGVDKNGFLDLGTIKGNQGDQNYVLPSGTDLKQYGAVAIWCKRFSVNFGGSNLKEVEKTSFRSDAGFTLAAYDRIVVTDGALTSGGKAALVEDGGKRATELTGLKLKSAGTAFIVELENAPTYSQFLKSKKVKLGDIKSGTKSAKFSTSKDLDIWLYRTIVITDASGKKILGTAELRSAQERTRKEESFLFA